MWSTSHLPRRRKELWSLTLTQPVLPELSSCLPMAPAVALSITHTDRLPFCRHRLLQSLLRLPRTSRFKLSRRCSHRTKIGRLYQAVPVVTVTCRRCTPLVVTTYLRLSPTMRFTRMTHSAERGEQQGYHSRGYPLASRKPRCDPWAFVLNSVFQEECDRVISFVSQPLECRHNRDHQYPGGMHGLTPCSLINTTRR